MKMEYYIAPKIIPHIFVKIYLELAHCENEGTPKNLQQFLNHPQYFLPNFQHPPVPIKYKLVKYVKKCTRLYYNHTHTFSAV